jgi:hypothetical protein
MDTTRLIFFMWFYWALDYSELGPSYSYLIVSFVCYSTFMVITHTTLPPHAGVHTSMQELQGKGDSICSLVS